jgi:hypothetical protein
MECPFRDQVSEGMKRMICGTAISSNSNSRSITKNQNTPRNTMDVGALRRAAEAEPVSIVVAFLINFTTAP